MTLPTQLYTHVAWVRKWRPLAKAHETHIPNVRVVFINKSRLSFPSNTQAVTCYRVLSRRYNVNADRRRISRRSQSLAHSVSSKIHVTNRQSVPSCRLIIASATNVTITQMTMVPPEKCECQCANVIGCRLTREGTRMYQKICDSVQIVH